MLAAIVLLSKARGHLSAVLAGNTTYGQRFTKTRVSEHSTMYSYILLCRDVRVVQVTIANTSYFFD